MTTGLRVAALLLWLPAAAAAQGVIRGVVTAADTGMPLAGVDIRVTGGSFTSQEPGSASTDADGKYEIRDLKPGRYTLSASRAGYLRLNYGQQRVNETSTPVEVADAVVDGIDFALPHNAVITVRLTDAFGDPAPGYAVRAFQARVVRGQRALSAVAGDAQRTTDDRGEIRLYGLAPGEYYIATTATLGSTVLNPQLSKVQTFYPGTASDAEAQLVKVALGEEIAIAFQLNDARLARIRGAITGSSPLVNPVVSMSRRIVGGTSSHPIAVSEDGSFMAEALPPAEYVVSARAGTEAGTIRFQVSGEDIDGLMLPLRPSVTLRGRVTFDTNAPPRGATNPLITPAFPDRIGTTSASIVNSDWTFQVAGVTGTGVIRFLSPPAGWYLKSVLVDGKDVTDTPLDFDAFDGKPIELAMTQRLAQLSGTVLDARGQPATNAVTVVFPEDPARWTMFSRSIGTARPDQSGRFVIDGLPAGRYLVRALDYLEPGLERVPGTLERLRQGATAVTLTESETATISLTLQP